MKTVVVIFVLAFCIGISGHAQVSINTDNSPPNPSSGLDVNVSGKGFLPPRLTKAQRNAMNSPAEGLIVICTDCTINSTASISIFINGTWQLITDYCTPPFTPVAGTHSATQVSATWNWNPVVNAIGYRWGATNDFAQALDMGTATTKSETGLTCNTSYTRYIWAYNDCGMSTVLTATKTTLTSTPGTPVASTHVPSINQIIWKWNAVTGAAGYKWNTTSSYSTAIDVGTNLSKTETGLNCNTAYTRYVWSYDGCGNSNPRTVTSTTLGETVPSPVTGVHVPSTTQIIWNWDPVTGATGYKWNTTNNYATATNMGTATSKTETNLICNTSYTRYIWVYSSCGTSTSTTITQMTSSCGVCGPTITDSRDNKVYTTVQIGNQCWMAQNLNLGSRISGSGNQANNAVFEKFCYFDLETNCGVYGGLYQWAEAVQYLNGATGTTTWNPIPTGNVQGICQTGWHLPTDVEWAILLTFLGGEATAGGPMKETGYAHWASPNTGATNSSGFTGLPGGDRSTTCCFYAITNNANFWSASENTPTTTWSRHLIFDQVSVIHYAIPKTNGFSIRCVKD